MTRNSVGINLQDEAAQQVPAPLSPKGNSCVNMILQGTFSSDADRKEFFQTFTSHGMLFLRLVNASLPTPNKNDLSSISSLARALFQIRTHQLNVEPQP